MSAWYGTASLKSLKLRKLRVRLTYQTVTLEHMFRRAIIYDILIKESNLCRLARSI